MWLTYIDWTLRVIILLVNIWLFFAIYRSGEVNKIYLFLMMYFLVLNDCLGFLVNIFHDIPSYFRNESILSQQPIPYGVAVAILCSQWFFHLFFLPVFSLLHFTALFYPFVFLRFTKNSMYLIVVLLYFLTVAVTVPLFTSCCGFIYIVDYKYWYFDYHKPYSWLYQGGNNWLQGGCVFIMVICNVALITKLYRLKKKNRAFIQAPALFSAQRLDAPTNTGRTTDTSQTRRKVRVIGPEVRLTVSFLMLSGCFFASTLAFNLLMGTTNSFLSAILLASGYLNQSKWIVYCLGNREIRKTFASPGKVFCF